MDARPPVCGTWANIWTGTGVFLKLDRPVVAPTRLAAVVELVTRIASVAGGAAILDVLSPRGPRPQTSEGVPRRRRVRRRGRRRGRRRRGHGPGLPLLQGGVGAQRDGAAAPPRWPPSLARRRRSRRACARRVRWTGARTSAATAATTAQRAHDGARRHARDARACSGRTPPC